MRACTHGSHPMEDVGEALGHEPQVCCLAPDQEEEGGVEEGAPALKLRLHLPGEEKGGGREGEGE